MTRATEPRPPTPPGRAVAGGRGSADTPAAAALLLASALVACAGGGRAGEAAPDTRPREGSPRDTAPVETDIAPRPPVVDHDPSPVDLLTAAVAAVDSSGPAAGVPLLEEVRERCGVSPAGGRATLLLAALHLDPRHAEGDPQTAAEAAAGYLRAGTGPAWTGPVARALYLQALENGASAPDPAGLGPDADRSPSPGRPVPRGCREADVPRALGSSGVLPELPGTAMVERMETLRARVAELEKELERIRDVLDEP